MRHVVLSAIVLAATCTAATAQTPAQPPPAAPSSGAVTGSQPPAATPAAKKFTLAAGIDFTSAYMFRGIFQEDEGLIAQPFADLGIALYSGTGSLKSVSMNVGTWNSIHGGPSGSELHDSALYETDYYASVTFAMAKIKPGALFTSYTSPNDAFHTVHELAAVVAVDDSASTFPLSPKAILAFELGDGQADGGSKKGTYLELSMRPSVKLGKGPASLGIPVKLGLGVRDYYEGSTGSNKFGFFDTGFIAGVALPATGKVSWEVHGGVDLMWLGDNLKLLNHDERFKPIVSGGLSLTY